MRIAHLVEPMGGASFLWGKEEVIHQLMLRQRDECETPPILLSFSDSHLGETVAKLGFTVVKIAGNSTVGLFARLALLRRVCAERGIEVLHTHGYKANVFGRLAFLRRPAKMGLVSTSHGFDYYSRRLSVYNYIDRATSPLSDRTTVTSPQMLRRFPEATRATYIANGLPDASAAANARDAFRRRLGIDANQTAIGTLCRLYPHKGIADVLACAEATRDDARLVWVVAGGGPLADAVSAALADRPNLRYAGYVENQDEYLAALDVYLQASHREGLSIALLQAMRAGLPVVGSDVGATSLAIEHERDGYVFAPGDTAAIARFARHLADDRARVETMGFSARKRFLADFTIERQSVSFMREYRKATTP